MGYCSTSGHGEGKGLCYVLEGRAGRILINQYCLSEQSALVGGRLDPPEMGVLSFPS